MAEAAKVRIEEEKKAMTDEYIPGDPSFFERPTREVNEDVVGEVVGLATEAGVADDGGEGEEGGEP